MVLCAGTIYGCGSQFPPPPLRQAPQGTTETQPHATLSQPPTATASPRCVPAAELPAAPRKVRDRKPPASELSKIRTFGGVLIYDVTIGTSGNVTDVQLERREGSKPSTRIADLWRTAIQDWKFEPTVVHNHAVPVCLTVDVIIHVM